MHSYESYHRDADPPPPKRHTSSKTNETVVRWWYTGTTRWRQVHTEAAWQSHKSIKQWCNHPDFQRPHATGESSKCIPFKKHQWGVLKLELVPKTGESILRSTRDILKEKYPPALRQRLSQKILMALEKGFVASGPLLHRTGWFSCRRPHHYRSPM